MPEDIVFWIVVLFCGMVGVAALLRFLRQRKRKGAALLTTISQLGSTNNLSFTGQEVLGERVLGFDGLKKKLLVLEHRNRAYRWYTISLQEVRSCSVQKTYRVPPRPFNGPPPLAHYVDRVELQFHCRGGESPLAVPFYSAGSNEAEELPALEARAHSWQRFLSKLLPAQQEGRA